MAGSVTVNGAWIDAERFFAAIPDELVQDVRAVVGQGMQRVRSQLKANVSGGVLKTVSGRLAASVGASSRASRTSVSGRAGSRYYIGRFWEDGFTRRGKSFAPRKWAQPVVDAEAPRIAAEIEQAIDRAIARGGF